MQDWPLLVHTILDHAAWLGRREVVSRTVEGPVHRYSYGDLERRARMIAGAGAQRLGAGDGRTMAEHLPPCQIWYELMEWAPSCTINPRLFADQLAYIINHAEDAGCSSTTFVKLLETSPRLPSQGYIVMTGEPYAGLAQLPNLLCYETLLAEDPAFPAQVDERMAAGICYTSGTTGNPKASLFACSARVLCAMMNCARRCAGATDAATR
jgi:fatty-acyl-CoA synthase